MIGYFLARLHLCQIRQKIDSGFLTPSFGFLLVVDFLLCFVLLRQCIILRLYKQLQVQTLTKFSKTYSYCYNLVSFQCLSFTALLSANLPPTSDCEKPHNLSNKYSKKLVRKMRKLYFYLCNTSKEFLAINYK